MKTKDKAFKQFAKDCKKHFSKKTLLEGSLEGLDIPYREKEKSAHTVQKY